MLCLAFEPGAAGWKTNQLSYGGTPKAEDIFKKMSQSRPLFLYMFVFSTCHSLN